MLKEEATEEGVTVFTSGSWKHRQAPLLLQQLPGSNTRTGKPCLSRDRVPQWGSSACHLCVNVLYINDQMSKEGLCPETIFLMLNSCSC